MTIPQNVADAVELPIAVQRCMIVMDSHAGALASWQTIRAHLLSQEAEIDRLDAECKQRFLQAMENGGTAHKVQRRLAAANALLLDIKEWDIGEVTRRFSLSGEVVIFILPDTLRSRIQQHLQGAGDEA